MPNNRSRRRILEQFKAADDLGMAAQGLVTRGIHINLLHQGQPLERPTVTIDLDDFRAMWLALRVWRNHQPKGDDLAPPTKGSDIRVPPDTGAE